MKTLKQVKETYSDRKLAQILETALDIAIQDYIEPECACANCPFCNCEQSVDSCIEFQQTLLISRAIDVLKHSGEL